MSLIELMESAVGHNARMVDRYGKLWDGYVSGFNTDLDNEEDDVPGYFSIDLDVEINGKVTHYEIREDEIKSIEVIS